MKLLLLALVAVASCRLFTNEEYRAQWNKFVNKYSKVYAPEEHFHRYKVFCDNLDLITSHNELNLGYELGMNEFGDLTWDEFQAKYLSYRPIDAPFRRKFTSSPLPTDNLPDEVDWVEEGKVNPIKNQAQCGSCWAFSAVAALETELAIKHGQLVDLSEQELVDCSGSYGNQGCNGGLMDNAFEYIRDKKGLCLEKDYHYTARDGKCAASKCHHVPESAISGFVDVPANNETELMAAAAQTVVSVAIEASNSFQFYKKGIYTGPCGTSLNHGVALVGYGKDGKAFWKVRNSWGTSWGEAGYIRMARGVSGSKGICGICMVSSYPSSDD
jgi:hypothetical protein